MSYNNVILWIKVRFPGHDTSVWDGVTSPVPPALVVREADKLKVNVRVNYLLGFSPVSLAQEYSFIPWRNQRW